jgi:hypothetical protein
MTGHHFHLTPQNDHSTTLIGMEAEPTAAIKGDTGWA